MDLRLGLSIILLILSTTCPAATFVVTSAADTGGSTCGSSCTLRQAINAANATTAADTINFAITVPPRGDIIIAPATSLPTITQPLTINGYSQSGTRQNDDPVFSNAVLRIRLDGVNAGAFDSALAVCANSVVIRGLSFTRFLQPTIRLGSDAIGTSCTAGTTTIEGNFIGLNGAGTSRLSNNGGISARARVLVGGATPSQRNVIDVNGLGVLLQFGSGSSQVDGNLFGTDKSGNAIGGVGVAISLQDADNSSIGLAAANRIRNATRGISLTSDVRGVDLSRNSISASSQLGIDLNGNGVTANDANDADSGANDLQNFPVITSASRSGTGVALVGTLDVGHTESISYKLTTYASSSCDPSGHGEGERILGQTSRSLTATAEGFSYTQVTDDPLPPGTVITMTATRPGVGTSEFSACFPLDPPPLVVNTTSDTADGACNAAHCSLREAIIASNGTPGSAFSQIHFAIPPLTGTSEILLSPGTELPSITRPVTIDGYTQPGSAANTDPSGSNATLRIRIDGANLDPSSSRGFKSCSGATFRGLSITRFQAAIASLSPCAPAGPLVATGNFFDLATDGVTRSSVALATGVQSTTLPVIVGGVAPADRNVFATNRSGVALINSSTSGSSVIGNLFGTDRSGTLDFGGSAHAVQVAQNSTNVIVGTPAAPNLIAFYRRGVVVGINAGDGARVDAGQNRFVALDTLSIDLQENGVTPNDPGDGDSGPNGGLNFPVLSRAERTDAGLRIVGTLDVPPGVTAVTVYASAGCSGSGGRPGEQLLGSFPAAAPGFDQALATDIDLEAFDGITATATSVEGTSEMSACIVTTDPPPGIAVDTAADSTTVNGGCDATGDANTCSLREAITLANAQPGADAIRFAIPGEGPHIINLSALLPTITEGLSIDGYTQLGSSPNADAVASDAVLKIEVRVGTHEAGLRTCTPDLVDLRGLAINGGNNAQISTSAGGACGTGSVRVRGSWLGFEADGDPLGGNTAIVARIPLTFGGPELADRNVVGNMNIGLLIRDLGAGSSVSNSLFGYSPDMAQGAGNTIGVQILDAANVVVGGEVPLLNRFLGGTTSIFVSGATSDFNRLYANSFIGANLGTAIDLANGSSPDGITPNDVNDADTGANDGQNTPVLTDASATSQSITVNGTLDVPTGIGTPVDYRIALYLSNSCSDNGGILPDRNGNEYLGAVDRPFASSAENFSVTLAMPPTPGFITATATSPDGSTSEISNCLQAPRVTAVFADGFE